MVELPADSTLDDLASCILDVVDFDGDHLSAFYTANSARGRQSPLVANAGLDDDDALWDLRLRDIFPLGRNKKLYYQYDFGSSWYFEITKKGKDTPAGAGLEYPRLVSEEGAKPLEYGPDDD